MSKENPFHDFRLTHVYKKSKIATGTYPETDEDLTRFGAVLNVSDQPCLSLTPYKDQPRLWLPIMESSEWDLGTISAAIRAIDVWRKEGRIVLVHCAAGCNRSFTIANLWRWYAGETLSEDDWSMIEHNMLVGSLPENIYDLILEIRRYPDRCAEACVRAAGFTEKTLTGRRIRQNKWRDRLYWFTKIKNKVFPPEPFDMNKPRKIYYPNLRNLK